MKTIHTIGILGGGQLGMMLAQAALKLGLRCVFGRRTKRTCQPVRSSLHHQRAGRFHQGVGRIHPRI
ncbi:phosphoribosylaminoimidazole carboxylase ATPase subunit [Moraxella caviae]|uniref:Phosphoribosylaminoimidazole carboxylase ATPase subunit n=1 Tax=Moraxella caviae TaxID=34060 RepID=A0A378R7T1_9GAMM|nr:phosphoribosylaminoimidazole carboxylase ATPase subunit [Moraxella caviae]